MIKMNTRAQRIADAATSGEYQHNFWLADGTEVQLVGWADDGTAWVVREGSEGFGMTQHYAARYAETMQLDVLSTDEPHPDQAAFERDEEMFGPQDADLDTPSRVELLDLAREIRNARLARAEEDRRRAWADYEAEAAELSEPLAEVAA
jgi:hypothetical protein